LLEGEETASAQNGAIAPWTATFYGNRNFTNQIAQTTYSTLNLDWANGQPVDENGNPLPVPADNFSVRFVSTQSLPPGDYDFTLRVDDQALVYINGEFVFGNDTPDTSIVRRLTAPSGPFELRVDYVEFIGPAFINLNWDFAGEPTGAGGSGGDQPPGGQAPTTVPGFATEVGQQPQPGTGTGWTGRFYPNTTFSGGASSAIYSALNLNFGLNPPTDANGLLIPGIPQDNFSAQFVSQQNLAAGAYTFTVTADDQARVTLNGVQILNLTQPGTQSAQVALPGGPINIQVDYIELIDAAFVQLQWTGSGGGGGGGGVQPTANPLISPTPIGTATPTPLPTITPLPFIPPGALTGTVINANRLNVRNGPSVGSPRLGRILRGETYAVIGRDPDARWFVLQLGGYRGWVNGFYLFIDGNEFNAPIVSPNTVIDLAGQPDFGVRAQTEAGLRLRVEPTTNSIQNGRIEWGAFLPVIGRTASGQWYKVVWKGTVGWVFSSFVRVIEGDIRNVPIE